MRWLALTWLCGWLLAATVAAQDFVPTTAALPPAVAALEVAPGLHFSLTAAAVEIRDATGVRAMASTAPTGTVHALTMVPWGTVVAGGENGVFVADAQHPVLDRADVHDGAPAAGVISVAADRQGRVWWCTSTSFGVLDLRLRFGRAFAATDGLPPATFTRVAIGDDGRLLLATAAGTFRYEPDVGDAPRVRTAPASQSPLTAAANGDVTLAIEVQARGGATLRHRRRHHHLLLPIEGNTVRGLRPGWHVVEVHAVDRDLRRTIVGEYSIEVPLPRAFDPRALPLAFAACLLALFGCSYRWGGGGSVARRCALALLRTGVLAVVVLQLLAAVLGYGRSWPFVGFSMYTENWHQNDVLFRPRIVGLRSDGSRVPLHEDDLGVVQDGYWQMLAEVVYGAEHHRQALFAKVARQRRAGEAPFVGFVLADGRIRLTAHGPVDVAPTVLVTYRAP